MIIMDTHNALGYTSITAHVAYASATQTQIVWIENELFFYPGRTRLMFTCILGRYAVSTVLIIRKQAFRRALTVSVDSCADIKNAFEWRNQLWQSLEKGAGKRTSEWDLAVKWYCNKCNCNIVLLRLFNNITVPWTGLHGYWVLCKSTVILLVIRFLRLRSSSSSFDV